MCTSPLASFSEMKEGRTEKGEPRARCLLKRVTSTEEISKGHSHKTPENICF